jgi:hypothetical protein
MIDRLTLKMRRFVEPVVGDRQPGTERGQRTACVAISVRGGAAELGQHQEGEIL